MEIIIDRKELILLLADCQLHLNWLKARDNQEKIRTIDELEKIRDLLLSVAKNEPTVKLEMVNSALIEVSEMLSQLKNNERSSG